MCLKLQDRHISNLFVFTLMNLFFFVSSITIKLLSSKETCGGGLSKRCPDLLIYFFSILNYLTETDYYL